MLALVEDEILQFDYSPALDGEYTYAAVLALPTVLVRNLNVPMAGNDIVSGEGEDVPDTDVLDIELGLGIGSVILNQLS